MEFQIDGEYIELVKLLKAADLVQTGGEASFVIKSGLVYVDGEVDSRKRGKIRPGQRVFYDGETIVVK